jgi:V8-like Glu-specific endopeptidase
MKTSQFFSLRSLLSRFTALTLVLSQLSLGVAGKTVHLQLEGGITYVKGNFDYKKDRNSYYTAPYKPQKPPQQSAGIYNEEHLEERIQEKLLIPGRDGRKEITETTQWPYLFHSQLTIHFPSGKYGGSGILVGPQHLLTAGHNVYDPDTKEWATRIIARLGLRDKVVPFGELEAVKIYTFEEWIHKKDPNFDMALITLNKPIGLQTGWCGLLCLEDSDLLSEEVHVTGYPGDKGFNQMWSMSHVIKTVEPEKIFYEIDTFGGQSGGGIWIDQRDNPYAIGIHTLGEGGKYGGNSGVRLSQGKFTQVITEWISATRDIKAPILKQIAAPPPADRRHQATPMPLRGTSSQEEPASPPQQGKTASSLEALQLKKADALFVEGKYEEALLLYEKFRKKGIEAAREKMEDAFSKLIEKGDDFYIKKELGKAFVLYGKAAVYGSEEAKERIAELGVETGDAHEAQGNQVEALKYYEQAAAYGSEEAKERLKQLKQAEVARQKQNQKAAEEQRQARIAAEAKKQKAAEEASRQAEAETRRLEAERVRLAAVPAVARDHVDIYERFLKGILVYRPDPKSDVGKIELQIADLANPLEGTFDLSRCGDAGKYLSIATGYRKGKIKANASKVEIWIAPRFLIEKNLSGNAKHFTDIMGKWDATKAPLGAFYTWGGWDDLRWYDSATTQDFDTFSKEDFYGKWYSYIPAPRLARTMHPRLPTDGFTVQAYIMEKISCLFYN